MKKVLKLSGMLTAGLTIAGAIFKTMHWPGAGILILAGGLSFSLVFLPLLIAIKMRDDASKMDKAVFSFGFFMGMVMSLGLIFKLMHWPYANILMMSGVLLFTAVYVPLYFFSRYRRPELKFNTAVNSVLMLCCGGIFFSMFNLSYSKQYADNMKEQNVEMHENSLLIYASNERLLSASNDSLVSDLHAATMALNSELENAVDILVEHPKQGLSASSVKDISEKIADYNKQLTNTQDAKTVKIDAGPMHVFNRLDSEIKIRILTQIQQQIAINENLVLSAL